MLTNNLIALLVNILEQFEIGLIEAVVRTVMLHAERLRNSRDSLKLDDSRVSTQFLYLFAIFYVNVGRLILLVMLYGEAISGRRALASETLHLRSYLIDAYTT
jgi:hypothetical protein